MKYTEKAQMILFSLLYFFSPSLSLFFLFPELFLSGVPYGICCINSKQFFFLKDILLILCFWLLQKTGSTNETYLYDCYFSREELKCSKYSLSVIAYYNKVFLSCSQLNFTSKVWWKANSRDDTCILFGCIC